MNSSRRVFVFAACILLMSSFSPTIAWSQAMAKGEGIPEIPASIGSEKSPAAESEEAGAGFDEEPVSLDKLAEELESMNQNKSLPDSVKLATAAAAGETEQAAVSSESSAASDAPHIEIFLNEFDQTSDQWKSLWEKGWTEWQGHIRRFLDQMRKEFQRKQEELEKVQQRLAEKEKTLREQKGQYFQDQTRLQSKISSMEDWSRELEAREEALQLKAIEFDQSNAVVKQAKMNTQRKEAVFREKIAQFVLQKEELNQEKEAFQKEKQSWDAERKKQQEDLAARVERLNEQEKLLDGKFIEFNQKVSDWEQEKKEWENQSAFLDQEKKSIAREKEKARQQLKDLELERAMMKEQVAQFEKQKRSGGNFEKQAEELQARERILDLKFKEFNDKVAISEAQKKDWGKQTRTLEKERKRLQKERKKFEEARKKLKSRKGSTEGIFPGSKELSEREAALRIQGQQFAELQTGLKDAQKHFETSRRRWEEGKAEIEKTLEQREKKVDEVRVSLLAQIQDFRKERAEWETKRLTALKS